MVLGKKLRNRRKKTFAAGAARGEPGWAGGGPLQDLFYATGHHRNGILLAPVTADAMARLILDNVVEPAIRPFGLERFLPARAAE